MFLQVFTPNEDLTFEYDDATQAHYGCETTFKNEFWYFGGNHQKRQVKILW